MGSRQTAHQTAQPRSRESRILTEQSESEFAICAVELDQALGGGVLGGEGVVVLGDGRGDLLGELLAELDALAAQDASTQSLIKFYRANREF